VRAHTGSIICEVEPPAGRDFDVVSWLGADVSHGDNLLQRCTASLGCENTTAAAYVWGRCSEAPSAQSLSDSSVSLVSLFRLAPGIDDATGNRVARNMSDSVYTAQTEGCCPAGRFHFLFQSPTTAPLDLSHIVGKSKWQVTEILERHGFDISFERRPGNTPARSRRTAQLRPNAAPVCVLVCSHGALYDQMTRNAAAVCRRLCATASSFHYGVLLSSRALMVVVGEEPEAPQRFRQSAMQRFEKVVRYYYEEAMKAGQRESLEAIGLIDCEETRVLFGDLADTQRPQHGGLMWRVLKRVRVLYGPKLRPASFARRLARGHVPSIAWPHSPATPVSLVCSAQFATVRHLCAAVERKMAEHLCAVGSGSVVLFHGTSAGGGLGILTSGVYYEMCISFADFGRAFYTSPQFEYAFQAALNCFPCVRTGYSTHTDGCVLAFVFEGDALRALKAAEVTIDGPDATRTVTGYRSMTDAATETIPSEAAVAAVLTGPICDIPAFLEAPPPEEPRPSDEPLQVAFRATRTLPESNEVLLHAKVYGVFWAGDEALATLDA
jgi:hypothetical protein